MEVTAALTSVFLGEFETEEAEFTAATVELAGELLPVLPLHDVRRDLVFDEAPDRLAELLVLPGEGR